MEKASKSLTQTSLNKISTTSATILVQEDDDSVRPDFIYGGPFIKVQKTEPFMNTSTPINLQLQGTFKKSFAYYSLRERLPVILTKVIDYLSRDGAKIQTSCGASAEDVRNLIQYISKLKNDLITNKRYEPLIVDTKEAKRWNEWIEAAETPYYFTNTWVFTECYVYRRLREGCELNNGLINFDPFDAQKEQSFYNSLEPMCVVAEKLTSMLDPSDKDKRKSDFITLLKICLWSNKCDLSLSMGEQVSLQSKEESQVSNTNKSKSEQSQVSKVGLVDPFEIILELKDKLLVDDTAKIADQVTAKAEALAITIEGALPISSTPGSASSTPVQNAVAAPDTGEVSEEGPKIPCPAKMTVPQAVMFDIVCDNAGYELFTDLCLAHFLVAQGIVKKVRFHVKKIPWFVSDVTPRDFKFLINACTQANYNKQVPSEPPADVEGEAPPPRVVTSNSLQQIATTWNQYVNDGTFILMCDDFWTSPHVFKDMKKYDYNLYRKLQFAVAIMFKGDLNYRKLLGEKNWNPVVGFESALQGFMPAPLFALRTVKADLICGLPKGKWEQLNNIDEKWMEKGDYGVIQFCSKSEPLKPGDRPCLDYGDTCFGEICPEHTNL